MVKKLVYKLVFITALVTGLVFILYSQLYTSQDKKDSWKTENAFIISGNTQDLALTAPMKNTYETFDQEVRNGGEHELTLVTSFINIGSFVKGPQVAGKSPRVRLNDQYYEWMKIFGRIYNPVVIFLETEADRDIFLQIRSKGWMKHNTRVQLIQRNSTWGFSLIPRYRAIIEQDGYPKHHPDTVVPEYAAIQHQKYEFMNKAAIENPFNTTYFAWLDLGLFRALTYERTLPFKLTLPPNMDASKIAYSEVNPYESSNNKTAIFREKIVWVCGCFFIGLRETVITWTSDYMKYEKKFLAEGLANADQQTVYAIEMFENSIVKVQAYSAPLLPKIQKWFDLAYRCIQGVDFDT